MSHAPVTARLHRSDPDCRPPRVVCSSLNHTIMWKASRKNFTFTDLYIGGQSVKAGSVGDFSNLQVSVGANSGKSVMTVDNACTIPPGADHVDYKYTLEYTDDDGLTLTLDPTIRNQR